MEDMFRISFVLFVSMLLPSLLFAHSGPAKAVAAVEAESHVLTRIEPEVPQVAQEKGIGGVVKMHIVISPLGDVTSVKVLKGHPFLIKPAVDAVNQWKYTPFMEDGKPIAVETEVEVYFPAKKDLDARDRYVAGEKKCRGLLMAHQYAEADGSCGEAVKLSDKLPENFAAEHSRARTLLANAKFLERRFQEAIPLYEAALNIDKGRLKASDAELATDYANVGRAYAAAGDSAGADRLFATSVTTYEAAIQDAPLMKQKYTERLKRTLVEYAQLKQVEGQNETAQELRKKAAGL
jgi:TonB family protein